MKEVIKMKAEQMKAITDKAMENSRTVELNANYAYAKTMTDTKFKKRARKGLNNCEFKVRRGYSQRIVTDALIDLGYEVKLISRNGRQFILAKW
jgi:hypothetical protein